MIDIHSHIIYGVDDGSGSIEQSISMIKEASRSGITDIFATSHYKEEYTVSKEELAKRLELIKEKVKEEKIDINIYSGREIMLDVNSLDLIKSNKLETLGNTKYILIEFNRMIKIPNLEKIIGKILDLGYKVIIAHPERYIYFQKSKEDIFKLNKLGVYFQLNIASLNEKYGKEAMNLAKELLQMNVYSFVGTDMHYRCPDVKMSLEKIKKLVDEETYYNITILNARDLIENKDIVINEIRELKKVSFFSRLFKK